MGDVSRWVVFTLAFSTLVSGSGLAEKRAPPSCFTHTRALTPGMARLLREGTERSAVLRSLVESLERTDVVVLLSDRMAGFAGEPRAYLAFLGRAANLRLLCVRIDPWRTRPPDRVVMLAHELEHACEIAAAPQVRDAAGMAALYREIGWEDRKGRFESPRARATSLRVRNELAEGSTTGRAR